MTEEDSRLISFQQICAVTESAVTEIEKEITEKVIEREVEIGALLETVAIEAETENEA